ncbi:P-loop containing nucleoside triphosphate hydrolase protein [Zopfochytrium polystomum]|nr:P-loop containing nucleoside triphosphate hydrolase protein [Zopfochytrium polystomum]
MTSAGTGNQSTEPFVPVPIVVCGPSGSGKSTLLKRIFSEYPDKFGFSVSHTTRNPRPGETNGKEYHFVTRETMLQEIEAGNFLESAQFSGNYYGTSYKAIDDVLKSNRNVILDIDMQGAQILQNQVAAGNSKLSRRPTFIFLAPPSRLDAATRELKWGMTPGSVDLVIVNDDVEKAYTELKKALVG